ncbi:hypothetical protein AXG93_1838s1210 [Marchantia polymorpha subsp. ruderalis]|uniref:Uncharacterized protein n=1 Tax=Marchantia polymorpha subsp. ruderalis TaxID=1480154 RepID=A0A176WGU2_MARPO|nr:hypothetical protein AXG93_1838s1210 [Marchantia polymorpha subsp. ruderalis]
MGKTMSTSTSYEGEDFSYLASAAQVEASVAVTRGGARTSEPRGATLELDPKRGEGGRQSRFSSPFCCRSSQFGVHAVVTSAESYDVLVGGAVLYPMGFLMDYLTETAAYRRGWQSGDGRLSELPVRFISRDRTLGSSSAVLASVADFSGVLTWPNDLLEGNMSADDTSVYEDVEEVVSFAAVVPSPLDVPL